MNVSDRFSLGRQLNRLPFLVFSLLFAHQAVHAQYYNNVDSSNAETLRITLHNTIKDHRRIPYRKLLPGTTDTAWTVLEEADENPNNSLEVVDLYRNRVFTKDTDRYQSGSTAGKYSKEHAWPNSYGFPGSRHVQNPPYNYPYDDLHALFIVDQDWNSSRSNNPYRFCGPPVCTEKITDSTNGTGGSTGAAYPKNSNWRSGSVTSPPTSKKWETWKERRGDVARALFYMDVRYEGGIHSGHGDNISEEPDLVLVDDMSLVVPTGVNVFGSGQTGTAYMGSLSTLLRWHYEDPVSPAEIRRNNTIFQYQGNRNPFIDHPEWVPILYNPNLKINRIIDLGKGVLPAAVNDSGVVVGSYNPPGTVGTSQQRAFSWSGGNLTDLGALSPGTICDASHATGINNAGTIVGYSCIVIPQPQPPDIITTHAVSWAGGSMTNINQSLPVPGIGSGPLAAYAINQAGDATGDAFRYVGGAPVMLPQPGSGYSYWTGRGINEAGVVAGFGNFGSIASSNRAFLWRPGQPTPELLDGGNQGSEAHDINDDGIVVGNWDDAYPKAVLWRYGRLRELIIGVPLLTASPTLRHTVGSYAKAVNDWNQIVGHVSDGLPLASNRAFFWSERSSAFDLNSLLPNSSPWHLGLANDVNNNGAVVGIGLKNGEVHGFMVILEPEKRTVVNSVDDDRDSVIDDKCDTGQTVQRNGMPEPECTLRAAIMEANASPNRNTIVFDIPDFSGTPIIRTSGLPAIEHPVSILGSTHSSADRVVIDGSSAGTSSPGIRAIGGENLFESLVIVNFSGHGIDIQSDFNVVIDSFVGLDSDGGTIAANSRCGISLSDANSNVIGGAQSDQRNVVSGNGLHGICISGGGGNRILGNHIGTDLTGENQKSNQNSGISITDSTDNEIGASSSVAGLPPGNLISGNLEYGVMIHSASRGNRVLGNMIGLKSDGDSELSNQRSGVFIASPNNTVGDGSVTGRNVISGNREHGIEVVMRGDETIITSNFVGTNRSGDQAVKNHQNGVRISRASRNRIGGSQSDEGNLISGNGIHGVLVEGEIGSGSPFRASDNQILGNRIGVKLGGTEALGNGANGVMLQKAASRNIVGGVRVWSPNLRCGGPCNLISGNLQDGIGISNVSADSNRVEGNLIGLSADGRSSLKNHRDGVHVSDGPKENSIGAVLPQGEPPGTDKGNVISGNGRHGVFVGHDQPPSPPMTSNRIKGNIIGLNVVASSLVRNVSNGVHLTDGSFSTLVGGPERTSRNVISGNQIGVFVGKEDTQDEVVSNTILGNYIGTRGIASCVFENGACVYANDIGVKIVGASGTLIGDLVSAPGQEPGNLIANNRSHGIDVERAFTTQSAGTYVYGNRIGNDGSDRIANGGDGINIVGTLHGEIGNHGSAANTISGNVGWGIRITNVNPTILRFAIKGNRVGTDSTGQLVDVDAIANNGNDLGNEQGGILLQDSDAVLIGGLVSNLPQPCDGDCNIVSGNKGTGIEITGAGSKANSVSGNYIGSNVDGRKMLGNYFSGISVTEGAVSTGISWNLVSGNGVAGNTLAGDGGIQVNGRTVAPAINTGILGNFVGLNSLGDLPLPNNGPGVYVRDARNTKVHSNRISGNEGYGVSVSSSDATEIFDNRIGRPFGVSIPSAVGLENQGGIDIADAATNTVVGGTGQMPNGNSEGNEVGDSIFIRGAGTKPTTVLGNRISARPEWMIGDTPIADPPDGVSGQTILLPIDVNSDGPDCTEWQTSQGLETAVPKVRSITASTVVGSTFPNALVELHRVDTVGSERARYYPVSVESLATATSDANGNFTISHSEPTGTNLALSVTYNSITSELTQIKRPVVFLPGIGGTTLRDNTLPGTFDEAWLPCCLQDTIHNELSKLAMTPTGDEIVDLEPHAVLTQFRDNQRFDIVYQDTFDWFSDPARDYQSSFRNTDPTNADIWRFAYDWRLDPNDSALKLRDFMNDVVTTTDQQRAATCEADILAHSMGGIVSSVYLRRADTQDDARRKIHRMITAGTPYLGTPQAVAAQSRGYVFELDEKPVYNLTFRPRWSPIIRYTRNIPAVYALMPSRNYWAATSNAAYLQDLASNDLPTHGFSFSQLTNSSANPLQQGLSANAVLWNRMLDTVHDKTDDWSNWDGPPQIHRIVGNRPLSTVKKWIHNPNSMPLDRVNNPVSAFGLNEAGNVTTYRNHLHKGFPARGDGTVVLSSAKLGRGQPSGTTDFSGVDRSDWIEEFIETSCEHTALVTEASCNGLAEILKILQSGHTVP